MSAWWLGTQEILPDLVGTKSSREVNFGGSLPPPLLKAMGRSPRAMGYCLRAIWLDKPSWIQQQLAKGCRHPHRFPLLPSGRKTRVTRIQTGLGNFALGKSPRSSGVAAILKVDEQSWRTRFLQGLDLCSARSMHTRSQIHVHISTH